MGYSYDLHIHSALSPCAEEEMTPLNIVRMAMIKSLDFIAVADHNAMDNVAVCVAHGRTYDVIVVPAMELQTSEDIHLLCLFPTVEAITAFDEAIAPLRLQVPHRPEKFGRQLIFDETDAILSERSDSLFAPVQIALGRAKELVEAFGGFLLPAHIDRRSNSIVANLGFIPPELGITAVEISTGSPTAKEYLSSDTYRGHYRILRNSDAHRLEDLSEPIYELPLEERTIEALFAYLKEDERGLQR